MPAPALTEIVPLARGLPSAPSVLSIVIGVIIVGMIFVPAFSLINLGFAWRQWREGRGGRLRLFCVCVVIAAMQALPLLVFMFIISLSGRAMQDRLFPSGILVVWNWLLLTMSLGRPVRLAHSRDELPLVKDELFIRRVHELASAMRLPTPVVRLVRSLSGEQQAAAFAGGLPAPSLVVTDGILHRLPPDERDAVVGHELAHLANGSLWWLNGLTPVSAVGGLLAAAAGGGWFGVLFGLALRIGLLRIISRWFERDCDRRAAEVLGYATTASALRKIHAVHVLGDAGWKSVLVYATGTHPSCVERLASLEASAPEDDVPAAGYPPAEHRRRVLAARAAAIVWLCAMVGSVGGRIFRPDAVWPAALLVGVLTVPFWPLIDIWKKLRRIRKRTRQGGPRRIFGVVLLAIAGAGYLIADRVSAPPAIPFLAFQVLVAACGLLGLLLLVSGGSASSGRVRQQMLKALQDYDFESAARIGAEHPRVALRSAEFGHNAAVARVLSGDREGGTAALRANVDRHPRYVQSLLTLAEFLFDAGEYEAALESATEADARLKDDPDPRVQRAAALWRLGELDEAESLVRDAIRLEPDSGEAYAVLAGALIERGDEPGARDALKTAERLAPGLPLTRVVEAEAALRFEGPAAARSAVERAREAARCNPLAIVDGQVDRLEARLYSKSADSTGPRGLQSAFPGDAVRQG